GLLATHGLSLDGWLGPPWLKDGWFHAYLLEAPGPARQAVEALYRRLVTGAFDSPIARIELERQLVSRLTAGCERVVLGYSVRREYFNAEFSQGVENIAWDSQTGFNSAIFLRTVKLKDFPWNGWLRHGMTSRPAAAWNPIAGFSDPAGRVLRAAVAFVEAATAPLRQALVGFRLVKVDAEVRTYSDNTFTYVVPVIDVYVTGGALEAESLAALAPPWSALPWPVMVLMEEAVKRGVAAFSPGEARRRGVPWLDLARDPKTKAALAALVDTLAAQAYIPPALKRFVTADEAQTRWAALQTFY